MKKVIVILLSLICAFCVGLCIYFIAKSNNVASIELSGNIQTLYFVNSTTDVNFADAKLLVTYKDGSIKAVELNDKNVKVSDFTTSIVDSKVMKITYRSQTIDVRYSVINSGLYYLSQTNTTKVDSSNSTKLKTTEGNELTAGLDALGNDITTSKSMIYFHTDGTCDYYTNAGGKWYMDDGYYDLKFNYSIVGGTLITNLGADLTYSISADFTDGNLKLVSNTYSYYKDGENKDTEFVSTKTTNYFKYYQMKNNRVFAKIKNKIPGSSNEELLIPISPNQTFEFAVGSTYENSGNHIYLKLDYTTNDNFLKTVYVRFNETMLNYETFDTTQAIPLTYISGHYKGVKFDINYKVV